MKAGEPLRRVEVEVVQQNRSLLDTTELEREVDLWLRGREYLSPGTVIKEFPGSSQLAGQVESVRVCEDGVAASSVIHLPSAAITYNVYKLVRLGAEVEEICQEGEEEVPAAQHWMMPNKEFDGVWESLVYDSEIKPELLRFVSTALLLSDRGVDPALVTCNRVVLLHGPPGTGKTSLCKALAQKLSIKLADRYSSTHLVEINSHSLFSKWFSESGKLVQKMFGEIQRLMEDRRHLVCVLIDEVESLTAARKSSLGGAEPSDALRVVNALLTQLDTIRNQPNVLILTTSNITGAIDLAFVDRADIKQYVGHPSQGAIYQILHSCVAELVRAGLVGQDCQSLLSYRELQLVGLERSPASQAGLQLWEAAGAAAGLSGRTLRKIPFLALALYSPVVSRTGSAVLMTEYLVCIRKAVERQLQDRKDLEKD